MLQKSILNPVEKNFDRLSNYNITKYEKLNMEYPVNLVPGNVEISYMKIS